MAGVPWTINRVRQHVISEVSQALHKILIFNNQSNTPIYKWEQGKWFSHWSLEEGVNTCTIYAYIAIPENKLKIRKGREIGWKKLPTGMKEIIEGHTAESIKEVETTPGWQEVLGINTVSTPPLAPPTATR